jgi:hypothetical protein
LRGAVRPTRARKRTRRDSPSHQPSRRSQTAERSKPTTTNARKTAIYCHAALANDIAIARQEKHLREYAKEHGCAEPIASQTNETESRTKLTYSLVGDYLLPNIALSDPPDAPPLGYYGLRHKKYLREEKPALYAQLLLTERLYPLCREIDEAVAHRLALIPGRAQAEEAINELIYE